MTQFLYEKFNTLSEAGVFGDFSQKEKSSDPLVYLEKNFADNIKLRDYQIEAFARFFYYYEKYNQKTLPIHLLFNMATGSGKTVIMAGLILYLYKKGYRNFLFFVDTVNIIDKTKANFLGELNSAKYLFAKNISIDEQNIEIKEVQNFNDTNSDNINIKFTTIGGLHFDLTTIKENSITFDDFENYEVVLLADEAHHLNANIKNKQGTLTKGMEKPSWGNTVAEILGKNKKNILLEFTATTGIENSEEIKEKYLDKIIYKYDLREFRRAGFSKEIKNISLDTKKYENLMLQAMILSQYRLKLAEKRLGIFFKPVILFKAQKTIAQSQENLEIFTKLVENLQGSDIEKIYKILLNSNDLKLKKLFENAFKFFGSKKKDFEKLAKELKVDFGEEKVLFTNEKSKGAKSLTKKVKEDLERTQKLINSLEDKDNLIRAIFTVNKLNEGWDVLNLFDIVRLYDTRDEGKNKTGKRKAGKTTISEVQLIGRGARYNPFALPKKLLAPNILNEVNKRKFDNCEENELRILEEFYYHAKYNQRYISELENELVNQQLRDREPKTEVILKLKDDFVKTDLYKKGKIFVNTREEVKREKIDSFKKLRFNTTISTNFVKQQDLLDGKYIDNLEMTNREFAMKDFDKNLIKKAISQSRFFVFENIIKYFPVLKSIDDLIENDNFLAGVKIDIKSIPDNLKKINTADRLEILSDVLNFLENQIKENYSEYEGTEKFIPKEIKTIFKKEHKFYISGQDSERAKKQKDFGMGVDLSTRKWNAYNDNYGTSEEKYLVELMDKMIEDLKKKFTDIYLLRNELFFKIYDFQKGRAFQPDFVLFMKNKNGKEISYQLFVEPKGNQYLGSDATFETGKEGWKEEFLLEIEKRFKVDKIWENKKVKIIGIPFYNRNYTEKIVEEKLMKI
jgi:type III restriction enzyme